MEPFVQRMLERAKARREKLDTQLSNSGHDVIRRSPLKDANTLLVQATITMNKSPVKSPIKATVDSKLSVKSPQKSPVSKSLSFETNEKANKENGEFGTCNVRSKLQRLGKLYSDDDNHQLSSPIHRTEEKFSAEDHIDHKPVKRGARLDKLAALASTIKNWEDDMSHPVLKKPPENKAAKIQAKFNAQVKSTLEPQPSTSGYNKEATNNNFKNNKESSVKQLELDKTVLRSLEAQGFSRTKSNSRLVYDYKDCSQESDVPSRISPNKGEKKLSEIRWKLDGSPKNSKTESSGSVSESPAGSSFKSDGSKCSNTPEKVIKSTSTSTSRLPMRYGFNGSPKDLIQTSGSVLSKASMFEAKNTDTKTKDPAQMTLAERMALFERNKGEAPLLPKAPLTMSIPPKKLLEKDKLNAQSGSNIDSSSTNTRNVDLPTNKLVSAQRAIFEQGKQKTDEVGNHILQSTHAERQRELDMLRSRFNENREIVRSAAARCGVRTSESSEGGGKSSSPKNSPICPVKPTPAPDAVVPPPPPPPLPQPEIVSYLTKSPMKRQVAGSRPEIRLPNVEFDNKRIRVCPPKAGCLYPNLSDIETTTESGTESEYTMDSSEPVTAAFDEKSDMTDTETTDTEATDTEITESYIQNYENSFTESDSVDGVANSSFGRSILHELDERSLFNKKRSIEPNMDSSFSDISVLNEMDQYLDECLETQESHTDTTVGEEEGPTPPKLNRGSLLTHSNSFNYQSFSSPLKVTSPSTSKDTHIRDGSDSMPLMRTVSAYRREQFEWARSPCCSTVKSTVNESSRPSLTKNLEYISESVLVEQKIKELLDEVCTQQKKIEEASKALNLCQSTIEFNGSSEHVGGEWALLIATHKRKAALSEVQRLKREGTLKPVMAGSPEVQGNGSLIISGITLSLKQEFFRNLSDNTYLHYVCLMRHLGKVTATQATTAEPGDSCLRFASTLKFDDLHSDFTIIVEIYTLQTQPKYLPHERKYHINHNGAKPINKTPKKKNQFVMPNIQSPAGPVAVRSPAFQLSGYFTFDLSDIHHEQFALYEVSSKSPLEGYLRMRISRKVLVSVKHRGFLTVFEDISGLGAWERRWCLLKDAKLFYWIHPEDEHKKNPIASLDLTGIRTKNVQFVNRETYARPFTFQLETVRPARPEDTNNLVMKTNGSETTIEHFLLADTREEGLQWLSRLNKTLSLIRAWGPFRNST